MKKVMACILVFLVVGSLVACAGHSTQSMRENIMESEAENAEEIPSANEKNDEGMMPLTDVEVSDRSATVYYAGENFVKSVFAVGSNMLYVCGIKADKDYFLGYMQKEEDVFQEFSIEMDECMRAFNMAVDGQGRCHILWMSVEEFEAGDQSVDRITYEKSCITIVNNKGEIEGEIDVTDLFSSGYNRPFCFVVDREGNYYFESGKEIVQILNDGTQGTVIVCDGWIEGIGMGKSGAVYCAYQKENGERKLGRLEENSLYTYELQLPQSDAAYAGIYAGTDSELLIFNKESGAFAFDESQIEERVSETELPVKGTEIVGYGILSDGRICMMKQEDENTVFYYVPSGR